MVLQEAAQKSGGKLDIDIFSTREDFPEKIASSLSEGMAIENLEGPDGRPFKYEVGFVMDYYQALYPVVGIPDPVKFIDELERACNSQAKRLFVLFGDRYNKDLYFDLYNKFNVTPTRDIISRLLFLKNLAKEKFGNKSAEQLFNLWLLLAEIRKPLYLSESGGYIFYLGSVHQRWLTRPFVPFPEELSPEEKGYFRKYLFQAKSEENANDMADLQASRTFSGWSGSFFVSRLMDDMRNSINQARNLTSTLLKADLSSEQKKEFQLTDIRLQALYIICNNAENAISYQAQLDKAKAMKYEPEQKPDIGKPSTWERTLILETARKEIDNTALLLMLLESTNEPIIDLAPLKEQEDIRRLGPDFKVQLKHKLQIMNEHWLDYNRIYTTPNL